jgi:hypothetical protein
MVHPGPAGLSQIQIQIQIHIVISRNLTIRRYFMLSTVLDYAVTVLNTCMRTCNDFQIDPLDQPLSDIQGTFKDGLKDI